MVDNSKLRYEVKTYIENLDSPETVYDLFHKLNYPKDKIFDPSYVKKIKDFGFAKDEKEKINSIYTVISYDKLNVFLLETKSLTRPFVRYITKIFSNMYDRFLLILTIDYKEICFVFPDYEKKEAGKHKLKTTTLILKRDELYYTDIEIISNIALSEDNYTWREIWRIWKDAFNVQKVTEKFFEDYKKTFFVVRKYLKKQKIDTKTAHEFTLQFLNRIMFIYFIAKKGWLNKDSKFIKSFWETYRRVRNFGDDEFYSKWLQPLFFEAFNNKSEYHAELPEEINRILSGSPYLNGGLFSKKEGLDDLDINITDSLFKQIFAFFESYNFTIKEDSVLDIEVSVDPQMIGYVYESLANISEDVYEKEEDLRGDWGIFYTARVEVDFMCRRSLVEYLSKHLDIPKEELYEFVFDENKEKIEKKFNQRRCWRKIEEVLDNISAVDPACGSGAFLVGMLNVLVELYKLVYKHTDGNFDDFKIKYRIIQRSLYGVDVMPWAIHASELRLWLQLIVETEIKHEKLREHPLLPNLNMNLRIGDSLVQEIGGLSFNVRGNNLKSHLKSKLKELQVEKRKYFESSPSAKFTSVDEFKREEIKLFEEILDERIESLKTDNEVLEHTKKKRGKQTGLFGADVNLDAEGFRKEKQKIAEIEREIEGNEKEIEKLNKVKKLLHNPETKPFVWDIDFAEVFAEKGGFDVVIGNPPYVRQEKIAPPNVLKEDMTLEGRREYKDRLIKSVKNRFPVIETWDKKSDLYVYFYFHGLSLLNKEGVFCFITSNSWLDVGYGKQLQDFLLRYSHVIGIYDNQAKRSFEHADVNTIIALFGAPVIKKQKSLFDYGMAYNGNGKNAYFGFNQTAKFVMFKKPFEETINSVNMIKIDKAKETFKTDDFRAYCKNQEDLLEEGWEYPDDFDSKKEYRFSKGKFAGDKWGGKYLRAPDIYFTILEKGKGKLVKLSSITKIEFGAHTNLDEFFIINSEIIQKFRIEKEFVEIIISSAREITKPIIELNNIRTYLFICRKKKEELKGRNVLNYIEWGENQRTRNRQQRLGGPYYHKVPSLQRNKPEWYSTNEKDSRKTTVFFLYAWSHYQKCPFSNEPVASNTAFHRIYSYNENNSKSIAAILNSTITLLYVFIMGRAGLGQGVLKFEKSDLQRLMYILDITKSDDLRKNLESKFEILGKRKFLSIIEECGIDSSKPIREQEPKPLPDRAELDKIIFDELGLTEDERKEVYWAVCELVKQRLDKARSLRK